MRILSFAAWVAGLGLIGFLVYWADAGAVLRSAAVVGSGFAWVLLIRVVLLYVDAHSWRLLLRPVVRPGVHMAAFQRWIGESVSVLLPLAAVGGELVRVRLALLFGIPPAPGLASLVMDAVVAAVSQMLFFGLGVALYGQIVPTAGDADALGRPIFFGGVALSMVVCAMWLAIRGGLLGRFARLVAGMFASERVVWLADAMSTLDEHVQAIADDRSAFSWSVAWRLLGWVMGATEVWVILYLLGRPISVAEALVLDALTGAVRTAFFFVPGGLGVQEGALMLLGGTLGVAGETMLAAALVKRAREVSMSIPGLLAWNLVETRAMRR